MTDRPTCRSRMQAGERLYGTMAFELFTPGLTAILAEAGLDFVILDMEHSGAGIDTIKQQIACARGLPIEVWVRVPEKSYAAVATVLDAGAQGIMMPMLETEAEAKALVEWARYRPEGKRGLAFGMAHDDYRAKDPAGAMAFANARNVLIPLIETKKGIRNADAILAVPGIDIGWLGHFDLTNDLGITAQFDHEDFWDAVKTLGKAGKKHGKPLGIVDGDPAFVGRLVKNGFRILGFANDSAVLRNGMRAGVGSLRSL